MTYLWSPALEIVMRCQQENPERFQWQQHWHLITQIEDHWRLDSEWWQVRIWREYYRVITDRGWLALIYQDLVNSQWYLQQIYD
jgi:hypothetical protein